MKYETLILEPDRYNSAAIEIYRNLGPVIFLDCDIKKVAGKKKISIIVSRLRYNLSDKFLRQFPNLKYIVSPTTGLNHIDMAYCRSMGIKVISLKGESVFLDSVRSTSEHTLGLILALVRNIIPSVSSVLNDRVWDRDQFIGRELSAMTLGVMGAGRIGRHMISYAHFLQMNVLVCDPFKRRSDIGKLDVNVCSKDKLLASSDIVTVHIDYRAENKNMFTMREFGQMKKGSFFINTSRGELVSEPDLISALESGHLAGAAVDVLSDEHEDEQLFEKPIIEYARQNNNLIITPHVGGCTLDAMQKTELFVAKKMQKTFQESGTKERS